MYVYIVVLCFLRYGDCFLMMNFMLSVKYTEESGNDSMNRNGLDEQKRALESNAEEITFSKLPHYFSSGKSSNRFELKLMMYLI